MNVPRIAAIGLASWDTLMLVDRYPAAGNYAIVEVQRSLPGGTTTNLATALSHLGAQVNLRAVVGDDDDGRQLVSELSLAGIDTTSITIREGERTDASTVIISRQPMDRTIYWHVGAAIRKGDALDIDTFFGQDVLVLDVADAPLRRFLSDLPAHTRPAVRMLGTLTYLVDSGEPDEMDVALRFDTLVGNEREYESLTGISDPHDAMRAIADRMPGSNLRAAVMSTGDRGCQVVTTEEHIAVPGYDVETVDTTGAGDAFAAGIAWGMAHRWTWTKTGQFANALGALSTRGIGAQTSLPTLSEIDELMETQSRV
ncbi:MAG: carbohydrate kinase family protein [Thermomicrobiales bacterium]